MRERDDPAMDAARALWWLGFDRPEGEHEPRAPRSAGCRRAIPARSPRASSITRWWWWRAPAPARPHFWWRGSPPGAWDRVGSGTPKPGPIARPSPGGSSNGWWPSPSPRPLRPRWRARSVIAFLDLAAGEKPVGWDPEPGVLPPDADEIATARQRPVRGEPPVGGVDHPRLLPTAARHLSAGGWAPPALRGRRRRVRASKLWPRRRWKRRFAVSPRTRTATAGNGWRWKACRRGSSSRLWSSWSRPGPSRICSAGTPSATDGRCRERV